MAPGLLMLPLLLALQDATEITDTLTDALTPLGAGAVIVALVRLAVTAHDKRATTAEAREKACTDSLSALLPATKALTDEVRRSGDGHGQQLGEIARAVQELLLHARAMERRDGA